MCACAVTSNRQWNILVFFFTLLMLFSMCQGLVCVGNNQQCGYMTCLLLVSLRPRHLLKWVTGWAYCCHRLGARRTLRISRTTTSTLRGSPLSSTQPGLPYSKLSSVHIWLLCEHMGESSKMVLFLRSSVSPQFDAEEVLRAEHLHRHAALQSSQL